MSSLANNEATTAPTGEPQSRRRRRGVANAHGYNHAHTQRHAGPPSQVTPMMSVEIIAWWKARKALGTYKEWLAARRKLGSKAEKARELGISVAAVECALRKEREREKRQARAMALVAGDNDKGE